MKYNEFETLNTMLESAGMTMSEFVDSFEDYAVNEADAGQLDTERGNIITGVGRARMRLNNNAKKVQDQLLTNLYQKHYTNILNDKIKIINRAVELKNDNNTPEEIKRVLDTSIKSARNAQKEQIKVLDKAADKMLDNYTKRMDSIIQKSSMTDNNKLKMSNYWTMLTSQIKLNLYKYINREELKFIKEKLGSNFDEKEADEILDILSNPDVKDQINRNQETVNTNKEKVKAEDAKPEETKPEETKPEETKPEETKPEETKPEETKPEETKPEEAKPEDTNTETKPEETKPEETKPEETKSQEVKKPITPVVGGKYMIQYTKGGKERFAKIDVKSIVDNTVKYTPENGRDMHSMTVGQFKKYATKKYETEPEEVEAEEIPGTEFKPSDEKDTTVLKRNKAIDQGQKTLPSGAKKEIPAKEEKQKALPENKLKPEVGKYYAIKMGDGKLARMKVEKVLDSGKIILLDIDQDPPKRKSVSSEKQFSARAVKELGKKKKQ